MAMCSDCTCGFDIVRQWFTSRLYSDVFHIVPACWICAETSACTRQEASVVPEPTPSSRLLSAIRPASVRAKWHTVYVSLVYAQR